MPSARWCRASSVMPSTMAQRSGPLLWMTLPYMSEGIYRLIVTLTPCLPLGVENGLGTRPPRCSPSPSRCPCPAAPTS
jgi:hypothetical protein